MWKLADAKERAPWEEKAKKAKDEYTKFMATEEGQAAKVAKKEQAAGLTEEEKAAMQNEKAKKPATAYFIWLNANREAITKAAGTANFKEFSGKASELWKAMAAPEKATWEAKAKKAKEEYDAFLATDEGKAIMAAKKSVGKRKREAKAKKA